MAGRIYWHIGLMKTGTTYLQRRLQANTGALDEQGVLFPTPWGLQSRAVADLLGLNRQLRTPDAGAWEKVRGRVDEHPDTALVSMEFLAMAGDAGVARAAEQFPDADNRVVVTLRDLGRAVPAMWQETLKNRRTWGWQEYVDSIRDRGQAGRRFWRQQSAARIVSRWADAFGTDRVTVLTVPPPGRPRGLLWERFCDTVGIAGADFAEGSRSNPSLGAAGALLMRELNRELADLDLSDYQRLVKHGVGNHLLAGLRDQDQPIGFRVPRWLRESADRMRERLDQTAVRVVGDLDELAPVDVPGVDPAEVSAAHVRELAVAALAAQVRVGGGS